VFQGASTLVSAELGPTTATVGNGVFKDCALLKNIVLPESLISMGNNSFENCASLERLVLPRGLLIGSGTLVGATAIRSLKMSKDVWETSSSLVENINGFAQLVEFYPPLDIIQMLTTKRDLGGPDGYQSILDHYSVRNSYTVDWSSGTSALVKSRDGLIYDADLGNLTGFGAFDGILTFIGTTLTQTIIDAGIGAHTLAQDGIRPLHTVKLGGNFNSLPEISLQGTSIKNVHFPAESLLTATGASYVLSVDGPVVLPQWVVQSGPFE
jgi:hypothetical protein